MASPSRQAEAHRASAGLSAPVRMLITSEQIATEGVELRRTGTVHGTLLVGVHGLRRFGSRPRSGERKRPAFVAPVGNVACCHRHRPLRGGPQWFPSVEERNAHRGVCRGFGPAALDGLSDLFGIAAARVRG